VSTTVQATSSPPAHNPSGVAIRVTGMYIGLGVFAILAVVAIFAGAVAMKRRRDYGNSEGDAGMTDAEFRKIEGFDK
jgi:hypothetical protein